MNKKFLSFFILGLFVFSMLGASFASAADSKKWVAVSGEGTKAFFEGVANVASPVTEFLFGKDKSSGDNGFIAIMAFLLTILVVAGVLSPIKIFGDKSWINWGIAIIVGLIGVRFISIDALRSFTLGSEGLVGALFLIVPFIVVASLILRATKGVRKILWIAYGVVMLSLLAYNWSSHTEKWTNFYWIYIIIIIVCVIMFLIDGTIQKFFRKAKIDRRLSAGAGVEVEIITAKIGQLQESLSRIQGTGDDANRSRANINAEIRSLEANLRHLTDRMGSS